jgi:hypothetical protein
VEQRRHRHGEREASGDSPGERALFQVVDERLKLPNPLVWINGYKGPSRAPPNEGVKDRDALIAIDVEKAGTLALVPKAPPFTASPFAAALVLFPRLSDLASTAIIDLCHHRAPRACRK